jgi:hypothetical protein
MEFENVANKPELISGSGIPTYIPLFDSQTFLTSSIIQQINGELIIDGDVVISGSFVVTENVVAQSLTGSLQTDTIQFTAEDIEGGEEGQLSYSFDDGKLTFFTENDTPIELGRSTYVRVRNDELITLTKGTVVNFTKETTGQTPRVKRSIATDGPECSCFIGIVIKDIPPNQFGYIILNGVLDGLDLSAFDTGDQVYMSQTVSGSFSTTIPTAPIKAIRIGKVLNAASNTTQGVLFIRPENRTIIFEFDEFKETYNTGSFSGSFTGNVIPRVTTVISTSTITPNIDTTDQFNVTALAEGTTLSAPTGTPTDGQKLIVRIKDDGTARTIGYNAIYRAFGVALPTTTTISKTLYLGSIYNSTDTRWDVITVAEEM